MLCRFPEGARIQGFSEDPSVYHEAQDWGGFGVAVSCQDKHVSPKLRGVCSSLS